MAMDLVARGPHGRLDPLCACMLLWSGSVSFEAGSITWDGSAHYAKEPRIHDDVVSLYGVSHEEVEQVMPDLLHLLATLEQDEQLRVSQDRVADAVLDSLPTRHVSGMTLFLLQSGAHPLVIDAVDKATICMRCDEGLVRGIPDLQGLLCRMAQRLWSLRGVDGPVTVTFVEGGASRGERGIRSFEGRVADANRRLDARVVLPQLVEQQTEEESSLANEPLSEESGTHATGTPEQQLLRSMSYLESQSYAVELLRAQAEERLADAEHTHEHLEASKPDKSLHEAKTPSPSALGLASSQNTLRTLVIRSVFYLLIGLAIMWAGRELINGGDRLTQQVTAVVENAMGIIFDGLSLVSGQSQNIGVANIIELPTESWANGLRVAGMVLMTLGVLVPLWKIFRLKRRLDRERALSQSHASSIAAILEKNQQLNEVAYAKDLDSWASSLKANEDDVRWAKTSIETLCKIQARLDRTLQSGYERGGVPSGVRDMVAICTLADYVNLGKASSVDEACALYEEDLRQMRVSAHPEQATTSQPTVRSAIRSATALARGVRAEPSEERRYQRIADFCESIDFER